MIVQATHQRGKMKARTEQRVCAIFTLSLLRLNLRAESFRKGGR